MVKFSKSLGELSKEQYKEKYYVDNCNSCKELKNSELMCTHPYYCWNDKGVIQKLEYYLNILKESDNAKEREIYQLLKSLKFEIVRYRTKENYKEVKK